MTENQKSEIKRLRESGFGYKKISSETGISINTIKSFLKTNDEFATQKNHCLNCGTLVVQTPHRKLKKFCSDICRNAWWSAHPENRKEKPYTHTCLCCGREFSTDRVVSKYCSKRCFAEARRGTENNE